ncbi:G protein alpha subunit [Pseudovirgaria hyperparasitica]|uniref:G protein alpha subunit n=1 Tax=Pseudovirgaria hyperparasitica TaxID=470096 RepID=A0A6A6W322_9PEZI|nr:G protein alpha subunit [Pseudovirgaria hyperparasitica]KAF2755987.1 G protein alpha subunit [Pseudovirgaria hyperparasitica]
MISESSKEDKARSVAIDRRLKQDSRGLCQNVKVLLFGLEDSGKDAMVKHMKLKSANGYTRSELIEWRQMIKAKLLRNVFVLLDAMEQCGIEPGNESNISHCEFLMRCRLDNPMNGRLDFHIGVAIQALWNDPCMAKVLKHSAGTDYTLDGEARYLFEQTSRIVQPHYEPTVEDILRTNDESRGIRETDFVFETFQMTIFDINTRQLGEQQKWIHAFETVTSIMFVVDLADYESIHSDHDSGGMTESLTLFDSMVNSRWFSRSSVILFLTNMHAFRNKLLRTPFSSYFPDYTGPDDAAAILQYIIKRFNACNRCHLDFFPHVLELSDPVSLKLLLKAVQETTVNNALRTLGKI